MASAKCVVCGKTAYAAEQVRPVDDLVLHKNCFRCAHCNSVLKLGNFAALDGKYYCKPHFKQLFALKGNYNEGFGTEKHSAQWNHKDGDTKPQETVAVENKEAIVVQVEQKKEEPSVTRKDSYPTKKEEPSVTRKDSSPTKKEEPSITRKDSSPTKKEEPNVTRKDSNPTKKEEPNVARKDSSPTKKEEPIVLKKEPTVVKTEEPKVVRKDSNPTKNEESPAIQKEEPKVTWKSSSPPKREGSIRKEEPITTQRDPAFIKKEEPKIVQRDSFPPPKSVTASSESEATGKMPAIIELEQKVDKMLDYLKDRKRRIVQLQKEIEQLERSM